jgi:hypothetical protein
MVRNAVETASPGAVQPQPEWQPGDLIRITHHAQSRWAITLTDWEKVRALEPFHIYSEQTVRDRFDWQGKGMASGSIHAALVEVRQLASPWEFPYEPRFGGCRSWVNLPEPPAAWQETARPVLDPSVFSEVESALGIH